MLLQLVVWLWLPLPGSLLLVGCGPSVPDITIHKAVKTGNIAAVKQHLAAGTDVNTNDEDGETVV